MLPRSRNLEADKGTDAVPLPKPFGKLPLATVDLGRVVYAIQRERIDQQRAVGNVKFNAGQGVVHAAKLYRHLVGKPQAQLVFPRA